jgi:hypothetical protein
MNNTVYDGIDRFMPVLFVVSFLAMLSIAVRLLQRMRGRVKDPEGVHYTKKYPVRSMTLFISCLIFMIFLSALLKEGSRKEIQFYLDHLDLRTVSIRVNGGSVANPGAVIEALHVQPEITAHHSHPTESITVTIDDKLGQLQLRLGRDSERPQEYWVFYPRYRYTEHNEVYRINTALFDSIRQ